MSDPVFAANNICSWCAKDVISGPGFIIFQKMSWLRRSDHLQNDVLLLQGVHIGVSWQLHHSITKLREQISSSAQTHLY